MKYLYSIAIILIITIACNVAWSQPVPKDHAVLAHAELNATKDKITLKWLHNPNHKSFEISRKSPDQSTWSSVATLDSGVTEWTDPLSGGGVIWEYQIISVTAVPGTQNGQTVYYMLNSVSYVMAGVNIMPPENQGRVIIIVEEELNASIGPELQRLEQDLVSEGWAITRKYAPRTEKFDGNRVKEVKQLILDEYNKNNDLKAVLLIGRIAVPYSGLYTKDNLPPDAHDDHIGAWAADTYYGDIDEWGWTDMGSPIENSGRPHCSNLPGDGKFDNIYLPSDLDLMVGRIDMYNMPAFSIAETELIRNYLNKNHKWRTGQVQYEERALIDDNFKGYPEGFSSVGWRGFSALVGPDNVAEEGLDYITTLNKESYLFSYGCGGGNPKGAGGIGSTADFAKNNINSVFTFIFGSYFGNWDVQDNFLRAPLCTSPTVLTNAWAARPQWYIHHMSLGFPIGYSQLKSQNNQNVYIPNILRYIQQYPNGVIYSTSMRQTHTALLGDPTLRLYQGQVPKPINVSIKQPAGQKVELTWNSPDGGEEYFYEVLRSNSANGPFVRLNSAPIAETKFTEPEITNGKNYYMIRTLKLIETHGGSLYNSSPGFVENFVSTDIDDNYSITTNASIYPNPAREIATIEVNLADASSITIQILDTQGSLIYDFGDNYLSSGSHKFGWNLNNSSGDAVSSGIYFAKITGNNMNELFKIQVVK